MGQESVGSEQKTLYFRVEAGTEIGLGNLKRCYVLARALKRYRHVGFICSKESEGYVREIATDMDTVIVPNLDHYADELHHYPKGIDAIITDLGFPDNFENPQNLVSYFEALQLQSIDVLMLDGLGDDSFKPEGMPKIKARIQPYWGVEIDEGDKRAEHFLNGPDYVLLGEEYRDVFRSRAKSSPKNIVVTFGGADPQENTVKVMKGLRAIEGLGIIEVIVGPYFTDKHKELIQNVTDKNHDKFEHVDAPDSLLPHYHKADLAICGSGATRYEAAACGLPVLFTAIYRAHEHLSQAFVKHRTAQYVGFCEDFGAEDWVNAIIALQNNDDDYIKMIKALEKTKDFGFGADNLARDIDKVMKNEQ